MRGKILFLSGAITCLAIHGLLAQERESLVINQASIRPVSLSTQHESIVYIDQSSEVHLATIDDGYYYIFLGTEGRKETFRSFDELENDQVSPDVVVVHEASDQSAYSPSKAIGLHRADAFIEKPIDPKDTFYCKPPIIIVPIGSVTISENGAGNTQAVSTRVQVEQLNAEFAHLESTHQTGHTNRMRQNISTARTISADQPQHLKEMSIEHQTERLNAEYRHLK